MEHVVASRSEQLDEVLHRLLRQSPEIEAAAVVSFDGLPMASALPRGMDEDRVAAMSAALLSLGERAAQGLGRGELQQVYIEGDEGTVFLVSAENEAVLVAVAAAGAKVGMMLYEVRLAAARVARALRVDEHDEPVLPAQAAPVAWAPDTAPAPQVWAVAAPAVEVPALEVPAVEPAAVFSAASPVATEPAALEPVGYVAEVAPTYQPEPAVAQLGADVVAAVNGVSNGWSSYRPDGSIMPGESSSW